MRMCLTKNRGRFAFTFAVIATALVLTACGGGGGGTAVTPPVGTPAATGTLSVAPATCTIQQDQGKCNATATFATANATTAKLTNAGGNVLSTSLSGTQVVDVLIGTNTYTLSANGGGPLATASATGVCAAGTTSSGTTGATCVAPLAAWWPPPFLAMGVVDYLNSLTAPAGAVTNATYPGQTQSGLLPAACKLTGDACWQEATRNGTIKFFATPATDQTGKAMTFAFYKVISTIGLPGKTVYCSKPFYAADGTYVVVDDVVENHCTQSEQVSFMSNELGGILREIDNGVTVCYQNHFDANQKGWIGSRVTCP